MLLRSLGYPTRVVSGLYAAPGRYDPRTRHTPVTGEDVHFWAEVRLPDGLWVAVEPTPGYELMPPVRAWSERIAQALAAAGRWVRGHAAGLLAAACRLGGPGPCAAATCSIGWRRSRSALSRERPEAIA